MYNNDRIGKEILVDCRDRLPIALGNSHCALMNLETKQVILDLSVKI